MYNQKTESEKKTLLSQRWIKDWETTTRRILQNSVREKNMQPAISSYNSAVVNSRIEVTPTMKHSCCIPQRSMSTLSFLRIVCFTLLMLDTLTIFSYCCYVWYSYVLHNKWVHNFFFIHYFRKGTKCSSAYLCVWKRQVQWGYFFLTLSTVYVNI